MTICLVTATVTQGAVTFFLITCGAALAMLHASPEAKDWAAETVAYLAEVIDRLARWSIRELSARAKAQRAARITWEQMYRSERSAGNWTPAAPSQSLVNANTAEEPRPVPAVTLAFGCYCEECTRFRHVASIRSRV